MQKDLSLQEAFDAAIGKKSTTYREYFRVNVPDLNKEQLTKLYKVKDKYHPRGVKP